MTHRERFYRIFTGQEVDRIPCYFFGSWAETKARWVKEGFREMIPGTTDWNADAGPQLPGMDPDWEVGKWNAHGLVKLGPIGDIEPCILSDDGERQTLRSSIGEEYVVRKDGTSISHTIKYPLEPTRESWEKFKAYLDKNDPRRYPADWEEIALNLSKTDRVRAFMGGSFYGWIRSWMGVENLSYFMYDDPELLEEMVAYIADHFMSLMKPILMRVQFDFVYFFEDCCGSFGPLFSPAIYNEIFDPYYKQMIRFYKENGIAFTLIDSDGWVEPLIPCWQESGFDIFFPIEVGKWGANPADLRKKFGPIKIFGAVNKNLIRGLEEELRNHLISLKSSVMEGGYLPIPDHRIPPEVSYEQMLRYIRVFHEVFNH